MIPTMVTSKIPRVIWGIEREKLLKWLKWFSSRALLLALNFAQFEWVSMPIIYLFFSIIRSISSFAHKSHPLNLAKTSLCSSSRKATSRSAGVSIVIKEVPTHSLAFFLLEDKEKSLKNHQTSSLSYNFK